MADLIRHKLVAGNARFDIGGRFLDLNSGQIGAAAAPMITWAVKQRPPRVVRQIAEQDDIVFVRLHRLQNPRQLAELALVIRIPAVHHDAVRHVDEHHAHRRLTG